MRASAARRQVPTDTSPVLADSRPLERGAFFRSFPRFVTSSPPSPCPRLRPFFARVTLTSSTSPFSSTASLRAPRTCSARHTPATPRQIDSGTAWGKSEGHDSPTSRCQATRAMRRVGRLVRDLAYAPGRRGALVRLRRQPAAHRGRRSAEPVASGRWAPRPRDPARRWSSRWASRRRHRRRGGGVASMDDAAAQQQTAFGENVSVDPATLRRLAADVVGADSDDIEIRRRRAGDARGRSASSRGSPSSWTTTTPSSPSRPRMPPRVSSSASSAASSSRVDDDEDERHDAVGSASTADAIRCLADLAKELAVREGVCCRQRPTSRSPPRWRSPNGIRGGGPRGRARRRRRRRMSSPSSSASSSASSATNGVCTAGGEHPSAGDYYRLRLDFAELRHDALINARAVVRANVLELPPNVRAGRSSRRALGAIRRRLGALTSRVFDKLRAHRRRGTNVKDAKAETPAETTRYVAAFAG